MSKKLRLVPKLLLCGFLTFVSSKAHAQINPDNTLGAETSRVNQNVQIKGALGDSIEGGAQRGINLFHSFNEFNIKDGQRVYFVNPAGVSNILTRVTGSNVSNILGTMGVDGAANLFLINPNGILFGKNASLDIGGSFVGTTANALQFGNQGIFSATNPEAAPLLTINPSAFLFNQLNPSNITNLSQAPAGINPASENTTGLRVPDGKSFVLVGGNINLDGGGIRAYSGRVELAGLTAPGSIGLDITGDVFSLNVGNNLELADISLFNQAVISVFGAGGGDIIANARNLSMSNSNLFAGIAGNNASSNTTAGNITLNVTGATTATKESGIYNYVDTSAIGNAGNININTGSLSLLNGSEINTQTYAQGNAGSININALSTVTLNGSGDTTLDTGAIGTLYSRISSGVNSEGTGKAGDINLKTGSLKLIRGGFSSGTYGKGDAGNITIDADDIALNNGAFIDNSASGIGKGGDIQINANTLSLLGGSFIFSNLSGQGNAGSIKINARSIKLENIVGGLINGIASATLPGSVGNSGNIEINSHSISITNGAIIGTIAGGKGSAGNIFINARDTITVEGFNPVDNIPSSINSSAGKYEASDSGNISINTRELYLSNSGGINANNFGKGNSGNIFIQASDKVSLSNLNNIGDTAISNFVSKGYGNGGTIGIVTNNLSLDNATINSFNSGQGNASNISINAKNTVSLVNKSYFASGTTLGAVGNGGNINIQSQKLFLDNNSYFSTTNSGQGNAGNVSIKATDFSLFNKSYIRSSIDSTAVGNGGNIDILTDSLSMENGSFFFNGNLGGKGKAGDIRINSIGDVSLKNASRIDATSFGTGSAGDIAINSGGTVFLEGRSTDGVIFDTGIFSTVEVYTANVGTGIGGDISLNSRNLLMNRAALSSSNFTDGNGGDINVNTGAARLDNQSTIASVTNSGNGGNIKFNATNSLLLRRNSSIQTTAGFDNFSSGNGGNINIEVPFIIAVPNEKSYIAANAFTGNGGNVKIGAQSVFGIEARPKPSGTTSEITASSQFGVQGSVGITQPEIQPTKTITSLPVQVVDATTKLSQICPRNINDKPLGEFVITGRGSLPPSPLEPLPGKGSLTLVSVEQQPRQVQQVVHVEQEKPSLPIIEAQGWVRNNDGSVELVAVAPNVNALSTSTQASCPNMAPSQTSKS